MYGAIMLNLVRIGVEYAAKNNNVARRAPGLIMVGYVLANCCRRCR